MRFKKVSKESIRSNQLKLILFLVFVHCASTSYGGAQIVKIEGRVYCGASGVDDVLVTDGFNFVKTNKTGYFTIHSHVDAKFIYLSTPAGYTTKIQNGLGSYFHTIDRQSKKQRIDFELNELTGDQSGFNVIVTADPQIGYAEELPLLAEIIDDIKLETEHLDNSKTLGIVCGDMIENIRDASLFIDTLKQLFSSTGFPFYYIPGNHDMEAESRSNFEAKKTYESMFGPRYYSFDRGNVHFVFLDNVFHTGRNSSYIGYLEEAQLAWLEKDLSFVPTSKVIMIAMHIPTYSAAARKGEYAKEELHKVLQNRQSLYTLLENYTVHIFTGHEHYQENYLINENIYEHVQPALSGIFWQAPYNSDGTPLGYSVYKVNGAEVSWYFKASGRDREVQFDAYKAGADENRPNAIIANVWNYDPDWKVYWYENGKRIGEMLRFKGWDPAIVDFVKKHQQNFRYKNIGAGPTEHLFYAIPDDSSAAITIEVVDRFGNYYTRAPRLIN